jgi:hypothetical protein
VSKTKRNGSLGVCGRQEFKGQNVSFMFVKKPSVVSEIIMQMWKAASVSYDGLLPVFLVLIARREYSLPSSSYPLLETAARYSYFLSVSLPTVFLSPSYY